MTRRLLLALGASAKLTTSRYDGTALLLLLAAVVSGLAVFTDIQLPGLGLVDSIVMGAAGRLAVVVPFGLLIGALMTLMAVMGGGGSDVGKKAAQVTAAANTELFDTTRGGRDAFDAVRAVMWPKEGES